MDPRRTLVAGLVAGAFVLTAASLGLRLAWHQTAGAAVFVVAATCVLAWTDLRLRWVAIVWAAALAAVPVSAVVAGVTVSWSSGSDGASLPLEALLAPLVLAGYLSFLLGPWVLTTAVLRHLLSDPSARPSYDLDELHS